MAVSVADLDLVKSLWPPEADMVDLLGDQPELTQRMQGAFHPDAEMRFYPDELGQLGGQRGTDGFAAAWREWLEPWKSYHYEIADFVDAGGGVIVVLVRVRAVTRRDGVEVRHAPGAVCTVRDGQIAGVDFYLDGAEALAAAGKP